MLEAIVGVALRAILASVLLGGFLAGLVLLATRTLSLTAATRHALWTTALVATALMPLAGVGVSIARAGVTVPPPAPAAVTWTADLAAALPFAEPAAVARTLPSPAVDAAPAPPPRAFAAWTPRVSRTLALGVVGVWALGALIGLAGLAASLARVRGLKRRSSPLDGPLADELPWLTAAGPGREIYLRLSYETETPVAIGFRRPVILIPTELASTDGLAAIESLILHEYAHLRRNDDWTNLVQRTIERVFWFNPIVWIVGRRIALEREIASDDAVVEKTGAAHAYAASLWKLAREMRMPEHAVVAPGALLTRKQISVRIELLLDKKRARLHRSPFAALGVALAGVLAVAFVATSAPGMELPAEADPIAAAPAPQGALHAKHVVASKHRHSANVGLHAKIAATQAALTQIAAKTARERIALSKTAVRQSRVTKTTMLTELATTAAQTRALQAELQMLRRRLAEAKAAATVHEQVVRIEQPAMAPAALPPLPALPAAPMIPPQTLAAARASAPVRVVSSSAVARAVRSAARSAARTARTARERDAAQTTTLDAQVENAVTVAMSVIPRELAQDVAGATARRSHFDGVRLSRRLIASCPGCSFRNADAHGLDLHDLNLNADDFSGADMRGANLAGARLFGVSLSRANLTNADLRGAQLTGVEMRDATFDGVQFDGAKVVGASLRRMGVHGAALRNVIAHCVGCEFRGLDLHGQDLHGITLTGADLSHSDLRDANLSGVRFFGVNLAQANIAGADLTNAQLETCDLQGVDLHSARSIVGMTMHGSGLDG